MDGDTLAEAQLAQVLLVFDIMYLAASFMTFDFHYRRMARRARITEEKTAAFFRGAVFPSPF
ncbi:MAG: hypothetical protein IPO15_14825 [Anaerolineae bacterium]|uniref:hypothetical protein n=1 Tax=Candidatus Amarolinea dominans TaxID=3140696 RepID=UPI0031357BB1|nr:hypothetical protein [Anaerolineae bacterium]